MAIGGSAYAICLSHTVHDDCIITVGFVDVRTDHAEIWVPLTSDIVHYKRQTTSCVNALILHCGPTESAKVNVANS